MKTKKLKVLLKKWQGRLGLSDWDITVEKVSQEHVSGQAKATIYKESQVAKFYLLDGGDRQKTDPNDQDFEHDLVHELLHVRLWSFDPNWGDGAETELFDDGTNGDETAGDHIFSVMIELVVDGGSNTWEWGALDANSNWIDGNWQFQIADMTSQTLSYTMVVPELSIAEIQGETENSPYDGYIVETWGIVTAVDNNGFFLQDDEMMWSGIFVYYFEFKF